MIYGTTHRHNETSWSHEIMVNFYQLQAGESSLQRATLRQRIWTPEQATEIFRSKINWLAFIIFVSL